MKMVNTYSLGALATIFSSTQALTGNDLVTLGENMPTGIIWNSDKSLCLRLSGNVFEDDIYDSPAHPGHKKIKKKNTCKGITASFVPDCADMIDDGMNEDDLPENYRFRIAEHSDLGDRFCIINDCDDGLNEDGTVYKLQWNGKKVGRRGKFILKPFGGENSPDEYFWFDGTVLKYGSLSADAYKQVVWRKEHDNVWSVKQNNRVDRYNFLPQASCEAELIERLPLEQASYFMDNFNRDIVFSSETAVMGNYNVPGLGFPQSHYAFGDLTLIEGDAPAVAAETGATTFQYERDVNNGPYRWFGFTGNKYKNSQLKVSFNFKWVDVPEDYKQDGHLGHIAKDNCGLKLYSRHINDWFANADCFDSWCRFEEQYFHNWGGEDLIIMIFDQCGIDLKFRINDFMVAYAEDSG